MPPYIEAFVRPIQDPVAQKLVIGVLLLVVIDFATGVVGAVSTNTFSSERMRAGLLHKYMELTAIALGVVLDGILLSGLDLGFQPVLIGTCAYISMMEVGSILELIKTYNPDAEGLVAWLTARVQPKGGAQGGVSDE